MILLLAGCGMVPSTIPARQPPVTETILDRQARAMLAEGRFEMAAEEYLRLAEATPGLQGQEFRLRAADALIQGRKLAPARDLLARGDVDPPLQMYRALLFAQIDLSEHRPEMVLSTLPSTAGGETPPAITASLYRTRALAYEQLSNHLEAARERVKLDPLLTDPEEILANHQLIWQHLARLGSSTLALAYTPPPETLGGWIELALIAKRSLADPGAFAQEVETWQRRYPGHPATSSVLEELFAISQMETELPKHIALLLPLAEGSADQGLIKAAEAIRDGFLAAWFNDVSAEPRPLVTVRSTGGDIWQVYNGVIAEGADFVVGPLEKPEVLVLAEASELPVPTLALNHADEPDPGTVSKFPVPAAARGIEEGDRQGMLFQFSLSPENEARQVAERIRTDGHQRAAVLTPDTPWGQRVNKAFIAAWKEFGGQSVSSQNYPRDTSDAGTAIRQLLQGDRKMSEGYKGDLVDSIFLAAYPTQARQIYPQLLAILAANIPVYATSHVYTGFVNAESDQDLEQLMFLDMPWVLDDGQELPLRWQLTELWPDSMRLYSKLYAFGVDAYRLIPHLRRLHLQPAAEFGGVTGQLSMDEGGRITRKLQWAQFIAGKPRLLSVSGASAGR